MGQKCWFFGPPSHLSAKYSRCDFNFAFTHLLRNTLYRSKFSGHGCLVLWHVGGAYKIMHVKRDAYIFQCIIGYEVTIIIAKNDNIIRFFWDKITHQAKGFNKHRTSHIWWFITHHINPTLFIIHNCFNYHDFQSRLPTVKNFFKIIPSSLRNIRSKIHH